MSARVAVYGLLAAVVVAVSLWLLARPGSVVKDTPFMRQLNQIHLMSGKVARAPAGDASSGKAEAGFDTVDSLVVGGILSSNDAVYVLEHHVKFYGFDPSNRDEETAVFEVLYTNGGLRRRIVGYADGHAQTFDLERTH